jgi:phage repressor protein C with HTH and peptisase S24 domain
MLSVARDYAPRQVRLMADAEDPEIEEERRLLGMAFERLRDAKGLTQPAAAERAGWKSYQAWQRYESGAPGIEKKRTRLRLLGALEASETDLNRALRQLREEMHGGPLPARPANDEGDPRRFEVSIEGRGRAGAQAPIFDDLAGMPGYRDLSWMFQPTTRYMVVGGESMTGYVEAGSTVAFDITLWPRRGDGCVVELVSGERYVKEYLRSDQKRVHVSQRFPKTELSWSREEIKGVYKIKARLD